MSFDTFDFGVFFALVFTAYLLLRHRSQNMLLLLASYFFYGYWDWRFLSLIWISTILDYFCALGIDHGKSKQQRKALLILSCVGNLGILGFFKYYDFFAGSLEGALGQLGWQVHPFILGVALPVGISFYTFQTMSYTIDVYLGRLRATRNFLDFGLFVAFFPQLVAGPIERATNLLPQIQSPRSITRERIYEGGWLAFWGLYKKVFVADNLARLVDQVYSAPGEYSSPWIIIATYAFAIQIYCDFSGYTDIARGVAKMLGFDLIYNFKLPYFAKDPRDFWRRWHISLSEWLRDYLYIPLGGGRGGQRRLFANLMITMTLGGLWHGAAWHFVLWGVFHGLLLIGYRLLNGLKDDNWSPTRARRFISLLIMFHWTCFGWLLFRVENTGDIPTMLWRLLTAWNVNHTLLGAVGALFGYSFIVIGMQFVQYFKKDLFVVRRFPLWARVLLYVVMYFSLTIGGAFDGRQFIYFQF